MSSSASAAVSRRRPIGQVTPDPVVAPVVEEEPDTDPGAEPDDEDVGIEPDPEPDPPQAKALTTGNKAHAPIARSRKSTEYEIMQRRKDVGRLRLRGFTAGQIAKRLNVSVSLVTSDLSAVQASGTGLIKGFDQDVFMGEHLTVLHEVTEHGWEEFHASDPGSKQRIQALDLIRTTQNDKMAALADVGLVVKAAQQVEHKHVVQLPWNDKLKAAVAQQMLNTSLTPQLAEPTLDEDHEPGRNLDVVDAQFTEVPTAPPEPTPIPVVEPATEQLDERQELLIKQLCGSGMPLETARKIAVEGKALADASGAQLAKNMIDKMLNPTKPE